MDNPDDLIDSHTLERLREAFTEGAMSAAMSSTIAGSYPGRVRSTKPSFLPSMRTPAHWHPNSVNCVCSGC